MRRDAERAAQDDAYVCGRNDERKSWHKALSQAWKLIDPLHPAGQPGSYARGFDNGVGTALETLRAAIDTSLHPKKDTP